MHEVAAGGAPSVLQRRLRQIAVKLRQSGRVKIDPDLS
jgi:hypothetical protein